MDTFSHIVEIDEPAGSLSVTRLFPDGKRQLYTTLEIPKATGNEGASAFQRIAQRLGEDLLLDSPAARRLLKL